MTHTIHENTKGARFSFGRGRPFLDNSDLMEDRIGKTYSHWTSIFKRVDHSYVQTGNVRALFSDTYDGSHSEIPQ